MIFNPKCWRPTPKHAYRVTFAAGGHMDVLCSDPANATPTAIKYRRLVGFKKRDELEPVGAPVDLGHRGTDSDQCPRCGGMFATLGDK
jgi:hypothetical protein